jgi:hypothetical protein
MTSALYVRLIWETMSVQLGGCWWGGGGVLFPCRYTTRKACRYPNIPRYGLIKKDGSVGIALGYVLDDRGSRVRLPAGAGIFSLQYRIQNGSGDHPASYPVGTRGSFSGGKAAGAWSWPLASI